MMNKALSLLGMTCRAGRLSLGHDMTEQSVKEGKSFLVILTSDASDNLKSEFSRKTKQANVQCIVIQQTMSELSAYLPKSVAVMSVNDGGFSNRFLQLYKEGN
jgi:ribosomal protein L7Ae-like RNA K-turn-binding protein